MDHELKKLVLNINQLAALTGNTPRRTLRQHKKELSSSVVQPTAILKHWPQRRKR